jgi:large subunit ribosomal protein L6
MSRIGKKPIPVPKNVEPKIAGAEVSVKGPKGTLKLEHTPLVKVSYDAQQRHILVEEAQTHPNASAHQGLWRAMINNMIHGVTEGYSKSLEIIGTGYRAQATGKKLSINVGYTHPVEFVMPEGLDCKTPAPTEIVISGCDKQAVGQMAANIRAVTPPEPYKGKGIRYKGEYVRKLVGKSFGSTTAAK